MGFLTAMMTAEVLLRGQDREEYQKRQDIIHWLWPGDCWKKHKDLVSKRLANTGDWLLGSGSYTEWKTGNIGSNFLVCPGLRIKSGYMSLS
jgi:hypothetical protein